MFFVTFSSCAERKENRDEVEIQQTDRVSSRSFDFAYRSIGEKRDRQLNEAKADARPSPLWIGRRAIDESHAIDERVLHLPVSFSFLYSSPSSSSSPSFHYSHRCRASEESHWSWAIFSYWETSSKYDSSSIITLIRLFFTRTHTHARTIEGQPSERFNLIEGIFSSCTSNRCSIQSVIERKTFERVRRLNRPRVREYDDSPFFTKRSFGGDHVKISSDSLVESISVFFFNEVLSPSSMDTLPSSRHFCIYFSRFRSSNVNTSFSSSYPGSQRNQQLVLSFFRFISYSNICNHNNNSTTAAITNENGTILSSQWQTTGSIRSASSLNSSEALEKVTCSVSEPIRSDMFFFRVLPVPIGCIQFDPMIELWTISSRKLS